MSCTQSVSTIHLFFFFQAEDGIRDKLVTGVQTCALPIYRGSRGSANAGTEMWPRQETSRRNAGTNTLCLSRLSGLWQADRREQLCATWLPSITGFEGYRSRLADSGDRTDANAVGQLTA